MLISQEVYLMDEIKTAKNNIKKFKKQIKKLNEKGNLSQDDLSELMLLYDQLFNWTDYLDNLTSKKEDVEE